MGLPLLLEELGGEVGRRGPRGRSSALGGGLRACLLGAVVAEPVVDEVLERACAAGAAGRALDVELLHPALLSDRLAGRIPPTEDLVSAPSRPGPPTTCSSSLADRP